MVDGERVCLLKPYTYMNNSGVAVGEFVRFYKIELADILIVTDDINLPLGRMRIRSKGSAGGHNGLKSIIAHLGSQEFSRLRIGVDPCPQGHDLISWVLGNFSSSERLMIDRSVERASAFCEQWCSATTEELMNSVNSLDLRNGEV